MIRKLFTSLIESCVAYRAEDCQPEYESTVMFWSKCCKIILHHEDIRKRNGDDVLVVKHHHKRWLTENMEMVVQK